MVKAKMAGNTLQEMHEAFKAFNQSGGGFLVSDDVKKVLEEMGETVTAEELECGPPLFFSVPPVFAVRLTSDRRCVVVVPVP